MLRRSYIFLSLTILFLLLAGGALCFIPKGELHLLLCDHHTAAGDFFFRYYTIVGEWVPYVIAVLLLLYRKEWGLMVVAGIVLSGLTTQVLKHIVDAPRPLTWFAAAMPDVTLPLVEGVRMSQFYSFPSGHTTSFFALFLILCWVAGEVMEQRVATSADKRQAALSQWGSALVQVVFFSLALLGGYSRIYLSQHFLLDVAGGALVGVLITLALLPLVRAAFRKCRCSK